MKTCFRQRLTGALGYPIDENPSPEMYEAGYKALEEKNIEEEKRLFYVACSRGKQYLYLLYPEYFYEKVGYFDKKSSFLK